MRTGRREPGGESVKQAPATERAADHRFLRDERALHNGRQGGGQEHVCLADHDGASDVARCD